MSASLKLGVIRPVCCAEATETAASITSAQRIRNPRLPARAWHGGRVQAAIDAPESFTTRSPAGGRPRLLRSLRLIRRLCRWRRNCLCGLIRRRGRRLTAGQCLGLLRDLGHVQGEILLLAASHDCDVCLTGGSQRAKDFLSPGWIIERRPVDRRHQVPGTQPETGERIVIAPWIHAIAFLLA